MIDELQAAANAAPVLIPEADIETGAEPEPADPSAVEVRWHVGGGGAFSGPLLITTPLGLRSDALADRSFFPCPTPPPPHAPCW